MSLNDIKEAVDTYISTASTLYEDKMEDMLCRLRLDWYVKQKSTGKVGRIIIIHDTDIFPHFEFFPLKEGDYRGDKSLAERILPEKLAEEFEKFS